MTYTDTTIQTSLLENTISDEELSLISLISGLDNRLEELDHNISMISVDSSKNASSKKQDDQFKEKINNIENKILELENIIKNEKKVTGSVNYLNTMPSKRVINQNRKGNLAADNLRLKRIESIEKKLNDFIKEYNAQTNKSAKYLDNSSYDGSESEVTLDDYYARSRGIFFGFLFSIVLIFLLIIVSTKSYFYFEFIRNLV